MRDGKVEKVGISGRIHPDNREWLKVKAAEQERSANWLLDKLITEAREADTPKQGGQNVY